MQVGANEGCGWCARYETCLHPTEADYCPNAAPLTTPAACTGASLGTGGTGGAKAASCTTTYEGPSGDPQVSTQCMAVWNYRCRDGNMSAADQNCLVYASLNATVGCPYCPGSTGTGGSGGTGGAAGSSGGACYRIVPLMPVTCSFVRGVDYCPQPGNGGRYFEGKTCSQVTCRADGGCTVR